MPPLTRSTSREGDPIDAASGSQLESALADRYRLEGELGMGGMARVYLARDLRHDRKVALKVLGPELAAALGQERFLREVKIAAGLTHRHILPLHDSAKQPDFSTTSCRMSTARRCAVV